MADDIVRGAGSDRVAETVRRALLLVGPSESGVERVAGEEPTEEPAV
jgi:hypothetical protein